jgi:hypothetical protein
VCGEVVASDETPYFSQRRKLRRMLELSVTKLSLDILLVGLYLAFTPIHRIGLLIAISKLIRGELLKRQ